MAINAQDMAHLNFMKKQQWTLSYYAILLLAAVFGVRQALKPLDTWERWAGTLLCISVLLSGALLLWFIQWDIGKHRRRIGTDATAYTRGLTFTFVLGLTILLACCTVVYALWRQ